MRDKNQATQEFPLIRVWRSARYFSSLADQERHLGHVVKIDVWHGYDAVHPNAANGFTYVGAFERRSEAKTAVEAAVTGAVNRKARSAAG